jgi:hypothetical protein
LGGHGIGGFMKLTIWLKGDKTTLYIGGDPEKKEVPVVTAELKDPQILIDPDRYKITIIETK